MTKAIECLAEVTLSSASAQIEITNIPQDFADLQIILEGADGVDGDSFVSLRFNGVAQNTNEKNISVYSNGTSVSQVQSTDWKMLYAYLVAPATYANRGGQLNVYIPNYSSTVLEKTLLYEGFGNRQDVLKSLGTGVWADTSAITSLRLELYDLTNFAAGTRVALYGVNRKDGTGSGAASVLTPYATGGIVYLSGGYFYHYFPTSGTFTPTQTITGAEIVIAGGGGGGGDFGNYGGATGVGGAGAGGYRNLSGLTFNSGTNYTVTIGANGGVSNFLDGDARRGGTTSFDTYSATGGGGGGNAFNSANTRFGGSGGSGGGGGVGYGSTGAGGAGNLGSYSPSEGNYGGSSHSSGGGGGGGGATAAGTNGSGTTPGNGGNGTDAKSSWYQLFGIGALNGGTYWVCGGGAGSYTFTPYGTHGKGAFQRGGAQASGFAIVRYAQ